MKAALVVVLLASAACGMRTSLLAHVDARGDDAPLGPPNRPEAGAGLADLGKADLASPDLATEAPVESVIRFPDVPADLGPDGRLDTARDLTSDRPPDSLADLSRDLLLDLPRDLLPDRPREAPFETGRDVPEQLDTPCAPGSTSPCTCDNGLSGARICLPSLVFSECGCGPEALMRVKNGMIGTWTGTATTPWVAPYTVTFVFDSYTHYSAKSSGTTTPALYYGSDEDSPLKRYSVDDVLLASGDAVGTIDVYFRAGGTNRDRLEGIKLSADLSQLKFFFMHHGDTGPLQYDLVRVVP